MKFTRGKKTEYKTVKWPTGYHSLPESGGLLDQPTRLMDLFRIFQVGEQIAAINILSKK